MSTDITKLEDTLSVTTGVERNGTVTVIVDLDGQQFADTPRVSTGTQSNGTATVNQNLDDGGGGPKRIVCTHNTSSSDDSDYDFLIYEDDEVKSYKYHEYMELNADYVDEFYCASVVQYQDALPVATHVNSNMEHVRR